MSENVLKLPLYAKISLILVGISTFVLILSISKHILVPLIFAGIIAIVLHPVVKFLVRIRVNRVLAIFISILLTLIVLGAFATLFLSQVSRFIESWPKLIDGFTKILNQTVIWTSGNFDISTKEITTWIEETKNKLIDIIGIGIGNTLINVGTTLMLVFVLPVYIFFILFYQSILLEFLHKLFGASNRTEVSGVINQIRTLIQRYLVGLSIEVGIVATLFTVGLWIMGIEYALFLGVIGALLNLIPYLGAILGATLPMIIAIITKPSPWYALLVMALYIFVQFIDNNYIIPKIVASQVKISALVSITAVFVFATLWGIPGMFLAIPLMGIVKLIFDHIEPLKPWGFLLGDTISPVLRIDPIIKKIKKIIR